MGVDVHGKALSTMAVLSDVLALPLPPGADDELQRFDRMGRGRIRAVYLSTPITTGERFLEWRRNLGEHLSHSESTYARELKQQVIEENLRRAKPLRGRLEEQFERRSIIDPTELEVEGWGQSDYHRFWLEVLDRYVDTVVLADGWSFSTGCTLEFAFALSRGLTCLDSDLELIDAIRAAELLGAAADQLELAHLSPDAQRSVIAAITPVSLPKGQPLLKDEALAALAQSHNVALFASFAPYEAEVRFVLGADAEEARAWSTSQAVEHVLNNSRSGSVNVRTFRPTESKSSPFFYGLNTVHQVLEVLHKQASGGYHTIVNETIEVHDGGVSGVSLGGVLEFGPDGTPRLVEEGGATSLPVPIGRRLLSEVYGVSLDIPSNSSVRYEFSIHPQRVGHRRSHVLVWESETVSPVQLQATSTWPSNFSRLIGDKTFGILLAFCTGARVPLTRVVGRRVAPFDFGVSTGTGEWWLRTAPSVQTPGHFSSAPTWLDPFDLMEKEDREGSIAAVLSQEAVTSEYSGATSRTNDGAFVIEGVAGTGDAFMLGEASPQQLPALVIERVSDCLEQLRSAIGDVRIEWAYDGETVWVLQMHRMRDALPRGVLSPGEPVRWVDFNPADGLPVLRAQIEEIRGSDTGIRVTGRVGVTSHVGDLLRQAGVPGRFA